MKVSQESKKKYISINEVIQQGLEVKKILEKMEKTETILEKLDLNFEAIIPGEVKEWGGSAHIPFQKKWKDRKVKVIVLKKQEEKKD